MRNHLRWILLAMVLAAPATLAQQRFFDADGVRLRYVDLGRGEPIVVLHGFSTNLDMFAMAGLPVIPGDRHRIIAMDCRGHGGSDRPHEPSSYGMEMVEDVVRLLDHLGLERAHIVGYSMGGMITLKLVTVHPDRVISAVVGGFGLRQAPEDPADDFLVQVAESLERGEGLTLLLSALRVEGQRGSDAETLDALNRFIMSTNDAKALAAVARGLPQLDPGEKALRENTVPTLAVVGEQDTLKADVDRLAGVMAHLEVVVVGGTDHMSTMSSAEFRERTTAFVDAHTQVPVAP